MTDFIPQDSPFTGRKMFLIIVMFFGVIIAVNGTMLTLAVKTFGGLVVGNSYVASQHFNRDIATAQSQPVRGWLIETEVGQNTVSLSIKNNEGAAQRDLSASLQLGRPTHDRENHLVTLVETKPGFYFGEVRLEPGQWRGTLLLADGQTRSLSFYRKVGKL